MPTLAELKADIAEDLHRTDLTGRITKAVDAAKRHYERKRFHFLDGITTFTATASSTYHDVPVDFKEEDSLLVTISGSKVPLIRASYTEIDEKDTGLIPGQPTEFAYYQDQFRFYPVPNIDYVMTLSYHKMLDLPSANGSNAWTSAGFDMLKHRATWEIQRYYLKDPEGAQISKGSEMDAFNSLMGESTTRKTRGKTTKRTW
jgi:hypothetical protein